MISYDDFQKVEIKIGKILSAEKVPETDKLLKLSVDFGVKEILEEGKEPRQEKDIRQIVSGIAFVFTNPQELVGIKCAFITNLEPRTIRGLESQGMILAVSSPGVTDLEGKPSQAGAFSLFKVPEDIPEGTRAK